MRNLEESGIIQEGLFRSLEDGEIWGLLNKHFGKGWKDGARVSVQKILYRDEVFRYKVAEEERGIIVSAGFLKTSTITSSSEKRRDGVYRDLCEDSKEQLKDEIRIVQMNVNRIVKALKIYKKKREGGFEVVTT